jgi:hypothetical protein
METLTETRHAIYELRTNEERGFGLHLDEGVAVGVPGIQIGEEPFDQSRHLPEHINPISTQEMMTGLPHVTMVMPYRPLDMNVVLHQDPRERTMNRYVQPVRSYKRILAQELQAAISDARHVTDTSNLYVVGDARQLNGLSAEAQVLAGTEEPEAAANAVADICRQGLTFIISNFDRLPLENVANFAGKNAVAVKANHEFELSIPAKVGGWPMDSGLEVNTNKSKELIPANEAIAQRNNEIEEMLGSLGLTTAQVTYVNQASQSGNLRDADRQLASAIRAIDAT